jgi:hypothetical protein
LATIVGEVLELDPLNLGDDQLWLRQRSGGMRGHGLSASAIGMRLGITRNTVIESDYSRPFIAYRSVCAM